ncbi:hypothetical protein BsWGS_25669 [Bradybaena similaris]
MADNIRDQGHVQGRQLKLEVVDSSEDSNDSVGREAFDPHQKGRLRGNQVSRPPSSHITRVDEEPSGSDGRKSGARSVETVDRGVGPTPVPPPAPPTSGAEPRVPPYFSFHPFSEARNGGLLEAYGLTYAYPHYPYTINAPLPLNPSTLEGRYHWPPASPFHQHLHGLSSSPSQADISLLGMRSPMLAGESTVTQLASRIHYEQFQRNYYHPLSSRRFSPASLPGLPLGTSPFFGEYGPASLSGRSIFSDVPPTPGSGSITLPGSLESSRLTSPRPSIVGGKSRKRALSHSPISDYLDIQSLTRSSEGSLQLASFLQQSSRSSSAASGSYGHLSAASVGTASPGHPILSSNPYLRAGSMAPSGFFYPPVHPLIGRQPPPVGPMLPSSLQMSHNSSKFDPQAQISTTTKEPGSSSIVSSTMDTAGEMHKVKVKKEMGNLHIAPIEPDDDDDNYGDRGHIPQEGEPDFIETNCHWVDCNREFETQDDLVKHINQDHIQSNKKSFVCRWQECSREEKPFKAQYMLVVHMRRHTGEKPHRCTFEGCTKAYSRLENLKTHLRSHTGEKPYMCEFPGCTKAFSNASDRAKHQNRTHSNAKPYVCKAIGCTKRYTDPSSLRKHVKTVHGADFYANKKHKGDGSCHVKKEDPDGDPGSCDANRRAEEGIGLSGSSIQLSGNSRQSTDTIGSAPSSNSQPSPDRSPEVNVTCGLGPDQGHLIDDRISSEGGHALDVGVEEEDVIIPESNEAEIPGSSALLMRRNRINTGQVIQNRLKGRINSKADAISPLPHIPNRSNHVGGGITQVTITEIPHQGSQGRLHPQNKRITDIIGGEPHGTWHDTSNTLLPVSRRESNTSTLSSYMSSMRSMGSTFSSRRSSGASQFSSRRSSGVSARLSIANSPYEYDISGNLPNSVSRRSSGESSTNIGNVSAMMQKTNLGSQPNLVVPPVASAMPPGVGPVGNSHQCAGFSNNLGNRCYNERLARYFSSRREIDGARTSTPCCTPLPHEIPDREIRRASDPVRTQDPEFNSLKNLQRFHSLNAMKPLPTPASMRSLQNKSVGASENNCGRNDIGGSNNTFHSSRSSIATDGGLNEDGMKSKILEADLEEKMLEDSEDLIIPDDMRRFLNERYKGDNLGQEIRSNIEGGASRLASMQEFGELDLNFDPCDLEPEGSADIFSSPPCPNTSNVCFSERDSNTMPANLQLQVNFADLQQGPLTAGSSPGQTYDPDGISPSQRPNFRHSNASNGPWSEVDGCTENDTQQTAPGVTSRCPRSVQQVGGSIQQQFHEHHPHPHPHPQAQQQQVSLAVPSPAANQSPGFQRGNSISNSKNCNNLPASKNSGGHEHVNRGSYDTPNGVVQGTEASLGATNPTRVPWKDGAGNGAYLSQQNLMQHQLHQQQQAALDSPSPYFMPHPPPHPPNLHHHQYHNQCTVLSSFPPLAGFSPLPPPGEKPPSHRQKRSSPQVQVPHISQSQIPANAKAANRNQALIKQQQQQQQTVPIRNPLVNPYLNINMSHPQGNFAAKAYSNQNTFPQGHYPPLPFYPPRCPYPPTHYPPLDPSHGAMAGAGVSSSHFHCNSHFSDMNAGPGQTPVLSLAQGHNYTLCSAGPQNINAVHPCQMPTLPHQHPAVIQNPACPGQVLPQYTRNNPYHPMEMSPGCNQVTSSTDCKETTAPPIEDFMDNLTSISAENLMDNIHSISQEHIPFSPTPVSMRSASQNSGRFNALMNTSNMVINDMSSVLTQLAEENRYLSMRH